MPIGPSPASPTVSTSVQSSLRMWMAFIRRPGRTLRVFSRSMGAHGHGAARAVLRRAPWETEPDPRCVGCGGIIRAMTILFEEALDSALIDAAHTAATQCDVMVAVGTGLSVYPVAGLFPLAAQHGARTIIVNAEETPFDGMADEVIGGDLQGALPALLESLARSA